MTWAPLLLADPSPCLRWLVLQELLQRPATDDEVVELAALRASDPLVMTLGKRQASDGSWPASDGNRLKATALALGRLGYLGFGRSDPAVQRGAAFLFAQQQANGAWPLPAGREEGEAREGYAMVPLQTAIPLRGLAACGYATDPRAERAYEWLLAQRLPDGAWPTGSTAGTNGFVAGYRQLAHSRWGCRSNTTGALLCLAHHPQHCSSPAAQRALDLLLGRETREGETLGFDLARLIGAEPAHGFFTYYARFDLAQILSLCWHVGATIADPRVAELIAFVRGRQGPYGLWEYVTHPQATRWITFDLLRSLQHLDTTTVDAWVSLEPRTPFRTYAKQKRRY